MSEENEKIPFCVYESLGARMERANIRLITIIICLIVMLFATNIGWILYENSFSDEETIIEADQKADDDSKNMIIGGDYNAGHTESADNQDETSQEDRR